MLSYIKCLFFASTISVTPEPVVLDGVLTINKPLEVLNSGAYLSLDVTSMVKEASVLKLFPAHSISAIISNNDNIDIRLVYNGGYSVNSEKRIFLLLQPERLIEERGKFNKLEIVSNRKITDLSVYWSNCGK